MNVSIQSVSKAIAGALVAALVAYLQDKGIVIDEEVSTAGVIVIAAIIGFVVVYFAPKNK